MITSLLLVLHIVICASLILVVLLQAGKGGGLAGAFGGAGGSTGQALFGGRGAATVLTKATTVLGIIFLATSLVLAVLASRDSGPRSVLREAQVPGSVTPALDAPSPIEVGVEPQGTPEGTTPTGDGPAENGTQDESQPSEGSGTQGSEEPDEGSDSP